MTGYVNDVIQGLKNAKTNDNLVDRLIALQIDYLKRNLDENKPDEAVRKIKEIASLGPSSRGSLDTVDIKKLDPSKVVSNIISKIKSTRPPTPRSRRMAWGDPASNSAVPPS